jgi:hypothetical protein
VGINNDNIYQRWAAPFWVAPTGTSTTPDKIGVEAAGYFPRGSNAGITYTDLVPGDVTDAILVNEVKP